MKVAVVGVTGVVGRMMLKVLEERKFPVAELLPVASEKSAGGELMFKNRKYNIMTVQQALESRPDLAFFSAGSAVSLKYAPEFAAQGCYVIDNSSAWRMHEHIKLIVPEVNASAIQADDKIISNPNCSTIQLVVVLAPLHRHFGIRKVVISTYQSVSGSGQLAVSQLESEIRSGKAEKMFYPYPIHLNCLPHAGDFLDNAYTTEEMKLVSETRKILDAPGIMISPTVVRVPVFVSHCESVYVEFDKDISAREAEGLLRSSPGIQVLDEKLPARYPMPLEVTGHDEVFVGRIRADLSQHNALNLWIVADNLRKGAATNAVQIAEYLFQSGMIKS